MQYHAAITVALAILVSGFATAGAGGESATTAPAVPVTIAVAEAGFNVYHEHFRRPGWIAHPSTYLPGYPADAQPLHLSLDAPDLQTALQRDEEILSNMAVGVVYYIPGTNIVAVVSPEPGISGGADNWLFFDTAHGTSTAAAAAGNRGPAPDAALVLLPINRGATAWISSQPWIDLAYDANKCLVQDPGVVPRITDRPTVASHLREFYESGRIRVEAAGNGITQTDVWCADDSHAWTLRVGGYQRNDDEITRFRCPTCTLPNDVLADLFFHGSPDHETMNGEFEVPSAGTSISAPRAAGHLAELIAFSRDLLDWPRGHEDGYYAQAGPGAEIPARGPLSDGKLNRSDLVMTYLRTAAPLDQDTPTQYGLLPEEHRYWWRGYGAADDDSVEQAKRVLAGIELMPERPHEDEAYTTYKTAMRDYWNYEECRRSSSVQTWISCPRDVESV